MCRQRLDAEALRGVVACRDQVDPELAGRGPARLLRLAREKRVVALVRGTDEVVAGATARDRHAPDLLVPASEDQRRAARPPSPRARRARRARQGRSCSRAPPIRTGLRASRRSGRRAARCCRARDGRRGRGGRRRATRSPEERLEPAPEACVDDERLVAPEEAVVHEHELGAELDRPLEQVSGARHAARDGRHLSRAEDLETLGCELGKPLDLQELVRVRDDLVSSRPRASLRAPPGQPTATLVPLGVWRSLVARSVRVGEVPSSNLGTPIAGEPCFPHADPPTPDAETA